MTTLLITFMNEIINEINEKSKDAERLESVTQMAILLSEKLTKCDQAIIPTLILLSQLPCGQFSLRNPKFKRLLRRACG